MKKYEKYNRKLNRLIDYNYSNPSDYFITICTKNRMCLFGYMENEIMNLNGFGKIVKKCWLEIPDHFNNIYLDEYIIMPNHIHGIITILGDENDNNRIGNADLRSLRDRTKMLLPKIIHGFKSSVTRKINKKYNNSHEIWQKSYYDHIIRSEKSLNNIRDYTINNPVMWNEDRNNPKFS